MRSYSINISIALLLTCFFATFESTQASMQAPSDIERIMRNSKWLDKSRPVRAIVDNELVTVSTYCHTEASDRDCKINALLALKELTDHYKNIRRLRISFFSQIHANHFRTVEVNSEEVRLVDSGTEVLNVLSKIEISSGELPAKESAIKDSAKDSSALKGNVSVETSGVQDGPHKIERAKLLKQIQDLSERQINTKSYTEQFALMEEKAKAGDESATVETLDRLNASVSSQLKALLRQDQKIVLSTRNPIAAALSIPNGVQTQDSGESEIDMMKKLVYNFSRKAYGDLVPTPGPYESDRSLIASVVISKKKRGYNTKDDESICRDLNNCAARGDKAALAKKIPEVFQYLHITQACVDDWRRRGGWQGGFSGDWNSSRQHLRQR